MKNLHAQALGKLGGKANTPAQNAARARNAKLGGRPKEQKRRKPNKGISDGDRTESKMATTHNNADQIWHAIKNKKLSGAFVDLRGEE